MPKRIQRRRTKGWRMPEGAVSVTRPGRFGNPFPWQKAREAGYCGTDDELKAFSLRVYREWLLFNTVYGHGKEDERQVVLQALAELRGKDLACFCRLDDPCHADILLEIANAT